MLELDLQIKKFILLTGCLLLVYFHRQKQGTLPRIMLLIVASAQSLVMFRFTNHSLIERNHDLTMFEQLQLPRAFTSEQFRSSKRLVFERYHPDRGTSDLDREQKLEAFQTFENYLSLLADNRKREMLDKFNMSKLPINMDPE